MSRNLWWTWNPKAREVFRRLDYPLWRQTAHNPVLMLRQIPQDLLNVAAPGLAVTAVLMLLARPLSVFICLAPFKAYGWRAKLFVSWAGLRGAVPIVAATFPIVAGVPGAHHNFGFALVVLGIEHIVHNPLALQHAA